VIFGIIFAGVIMPILTDVVAIIDSTTQMIISKISTYTQANNTKINNMQNESHINTIGFNMEDDDGYIETDLEDKIKKIGF
jgi:predicted PurR-regulated permease PerM